MFVFVCVLSAAVGTTIGAMFTPVGIAVGQLFPSMLVTKEKSTGLPVGMFKLLLVQAIITAGMHS